MREKKRERDRDETSLATLERAQRQKERERETGGGGGLGWEAGCIDKDRTRHPPGNPSCRAPYHQKAVKGWGGRALRGMFGHPPLGGCRRFPFLGTSLLMTSQGARIVRTSSRRARERVIERERKRQSEHFACHSRKSAAREREREREREIGRGWETGGGGGRDKERTRPPPGNPSCRAPYHQKAVKGWGGRSVAMDVRPLTSRVLLPLSLLGYES